jgi:hypothetical protein
MTSTPPDLGRPYGSDRDRAADRENLIAYWYGIESLIALTSIPSDEWTPVQSALVAEFSKEGTGEPPANRLRRWASLYREELALVRDVRNRIVRGEIVTDPELLGATWMGRQLLATVAGVQPNQVDTSWVRSLVAQAVR